MPSALTAKCLRGLGPGPAHVGQGRQVVNHVGLRRLHVGGEQGEICHIDLGTGGDGSVAHVKEVAEQPSADKSRSTGQVGAHKRSG